MEKLEIDAGLEIARKKLKKLVNRNIDSKKIQTSIYSFLIARGYDYDFVNRFLEDYLRKAS